MTELEWTTPPLDATRPEREPRRHARHDWQWRLTSTEDHTLVEACRCGVVRDPIRSRRGRTSRRAGHDAERSIAAEYGGTRTGQYGGPDDVTTDLFVIQSKAGGWFSERVWDELVKLPRTGGRIPTLVVSDRPGPGRKTRRYVVRMIQDDLDLHGRLTNAND